MKTKTGNHRIVRLAVENIMRIKAAEIRPDGSVVIVGGKNAAGKTSLLQSVAMVMGGLREKVMQPIRKGADRGEIIAELDNLTIRRTFTARGGSQLSVFARDGARYPSPQAVLDRLYSDLTFDPIAFSRMSPQEQAETLRKLCGLDFTEHDAKREAIYQQRRDINRDSKSAEARLKSMPKHPDAPSETVSIDKLLRNLEAGENENRARGEKRNELAALKSQVSELDDAITDLEAKLKMAIEKRGALTVEVAHFDAIEPDIDLALTRERIRDAEVVNQMVAQNKSRSIAANDYKELVWESTRLSELISEMDQAKTAKITSAPLPISGLGFDDDGVTLEGVPFSQCSQAEKLRVSVAIGLAMNPQLRILLIRDGSLLDDDNLAMIAQMAEKADAQIWIERVSEGEECSVIMENGSIKQ